MKILIAEDDAHMRAALVEILTAEGFQAVAAGDGNEALRLFEAEHPELLCLDVMMPGLSGYDMCRRVRQVDPDIGIVFITAKSGEVDTVLGLELGADDFISKPFGRREVVARIRAVGRRLVSTSQGRKTDVPDSFTMNDLTVVPEELRAYRGDRAIELGPRDVKILHLLWCQRGRVVSRDQFFDQCWGFQYLPNSRTLDQHISQLRKRVEADPGEPCIIVTVHGAGYRYQER